jgi:hypothetical protein
MKIKETVAQPTFMAICFDEDYHMLHFFHEQIREFCSVPVKIHLLEVDGKLKL